MKRLLQFLTPALSLLSPAAIWLPTLHFFFRPALADFRQSNAIAPQARRLAARHLALWEDPARREQEISRMRASNAEWDFMGRTHFVLAHANRRNRRPSLRYYKKPDRTAKESGSSEYLRDRRRCGGVQF
jgi:hypothetical protein